MHGHYNLVAGRSVPRLAALSDGVFAIALTLLVLELHTPAAAAIHDEAGLWAGLAAIAPKLAVWGMSFLTLGIFWVGQAAQLEALETSDRDLTWLHLAFLAVISLLPFSTAVLGEFFVFRVALVVYWFNIAMLGLLIFATWRYAQNHGLLRDGVEAVTTRAIERRVVVAQACYFASMLAGLYDTRLAIALIVLFQLNYAIAPRLGRWLG
jgi:uncharacterized membrane protein